MLDEGSCNVIWNDVYVVGKMILEMTKALKRIRRGRVIEEGEVAEGSDEEEGEMKEEQGDEVTIQSNTPDGKWRVITKHVGQSRLLILRFSTREELKRGRSKPNVRMIKSESKDVIDRDGFSYKWTNQKNRVRPGLNIFNKDGDELEWDYEHDTRFYVDLDVPEKTPPIPTFTSPLKQQSQKMAEKSAEEDKTDSILGKRAVKTKGRGSKRFKALGLGGSMAADDEEKCQEERKRFSAMHYHDMDDESEDDLESDLDSDRDPSPTPQPWDKVKSSGLRSRITRPSSTVPRRDY
ncbi:unnamed protein product [Anisakis simplex]|uniref:Protein TSSC4 n=1 Tax=Anisakis simplex TaxID=6269 RepID=A0A0M3K7M1_ANISI|nr:unnamed protein product [Anisakis simplex]